MPLHTIRVRSIRVFLLQAATTAASADNDCECFFFFFVFVLHPWENFSIIKSTDPH